MALEQYPKLTPIKGLVFEAYMSRRDIGSGTRLFCVYKVGRKYISLFYAPQLIHFTITWGEWARLYMQPVPNFDPASYKTRIRLIRDRAVQLAWQHPAALVEQVLALPITSGEEMFAKAFTPRPHNPTHSVRRG